LSALSLTLLERGIPFPRYRLRLLERV